MKTMRDFVDSIEIDNTDLALEIALALSRLVDKNDEPKYEIVVRPSALRPETSVIVDVYKSVRDDG
jgi:hypothetical protein